MINSQGDKQFRRRTKKESEPQGSQSHLPGAAAQEQNPCQADLLTHLAKPVAEHQLSGLDVLKRAPDRQSIFVIKIFAPRKIDCTELTAAGANCVESICIDT